MTRYRKPTFGSKVYHGTYWCSHRFARIVRPVYVRPSFGYDGYAVKTGSLVLADYGEGASLCRILGRVQRCEGSGEPWPDGSLLVLVFGQAGDTLYRRIIQPEHVIRILATDPSDPGYAAVQRAFAAFIGPLPDYGRIAELDERGGLSGHHIGQYTDANGALKGSG